MKQNKALKSACERQEHQNEKLRAFCKKNNISLSTRPSEINRSNILISEQNQIIGEEADFSNRIIPHQYHEDVKEARSAPTEPRPKTNPDGEGDIVEQPSQDEFIAVDDGNDQVDIKLPGNTFLTQHGGARIENDDLMIENNQAMWLPQTKDEYREFQKMAKFKNRQANNDLVVQAKAT